MEIIGRGYVPEGELLGMALTLGGTQNPQNVHEVLHQMLLESLIKHETVDGETVYKINRAGLN